MPLPRFRRIALTALASALLLVQSACVSHAANLPQASRGHIGWSNDADAGDIPVGNGYTSGATCTASFCTAGAVGEACATNGDCVPGFKGQNPPNDCPLAQDDTTEELECLDMTASKLLGRGSTSNGDAGEITLGSGLSMSGTTLSATGLGGDVVGPASSTNSDVACFSGTTGKLLRTCTAGTGDLKADGTVPLTADWDAGSFEIRAQTLESDVTTGTAPMTIASTTKVANLNCDILDDQSGAYYLDSANWTGTNATDLTDAGATTLHKHDHGGQDGLSDDDHTQYPLMAGRSGGQTIIGGTSNADSLVLSGQSLDSDRARITIDNSTVYSHVESAAVTGSVPAAALECQPTAGTVLDDYGCFYSYRGPDDAGNLLTYGRAGVVATDVSDGTEDGAFVVTTKTAGATNPVEAMRVDAVNGLNLAVPLGLGEGGTSATNADAARTALDAQQQDPALDSVALMDDSAPTSGHNILPSWYNSGGSAALESLDLYPNAVTLIESVDFAAMRTALGLEIGTNVQARDAQLDDLSTLSYSGNALKVVRVNAGATAFELATAGTGSGDLKADGTVPLTADWDVGAFEVRALTLESDVATGTAPFTVASTTVVTNLNADTVDGQSASAFQSADSELAAIAGLTSAANKVPYFTGAGTAAVADFSAAGRAIVDDADNVAQRATLGLVIGSDVQAYDADTASWAGVTRASGFDTFAATPSSANLRSLLTDESGTGAALFAGGALGTPASGTLTSCTGLPISTGVSGLGTGVATMLGSAFLDEDNMASNSATQAASQQSIKAYVDNEIQDIFGQLTYPVDTTKVYSAPGAVLTSGWGTSATNFFGIALVDGTEVDIRVAASANVSGGNATFAVRNLTTTTEATVTINSGAAAASSLAAALTISKGDKIQFTAVGSATLANNNYGLAARIR